MSEAQSIGMSARTGAPDVRAAIARAGTSSATGLYQFTNDTWLRTVDRHGANHGLDWAEAAISGGRVQDPGMRAQVMALRYDPDASALMAAELARDNRAELAGALGRDPDPSELYLAHFLGAGGARQFLSALNEDPGQSAAALLPAAASANRSIFYDGQGAPRSVAGVMELMRGKVFAAMDGSAPPPLSDYPAAAAPGAQGWSGGPIARQFQSARMADGGGARPSMADTLRATFAGGPDGGAGVPDAVRAAYGKLARFGL